MDTITCDLDYEDGTPHTEGPAYKVTVTYGDDDERPPMVANACRKCAALCVDYYRPGDYVHTITLVAL